jgi:hypothetical protein
LFDKDLTMAATCMTWSGGGWGLCAVWRVIPFIVR